LDDGLEFHYASDDENEDVDEESVVKNKRGKDKEWRPIVIYHNMVAAKASIRDDDTRVIGRINRGSTVASYYKFSSCGCEVQWRFITSQTSCEVVEEVNIWIIPLMTNWSGMGVEGLALIRSISWS
jgi:hypothetical protein